MLSIPVIIIISLSSLTLILLITYLVMRKSSGCKPDCKNRVCGVDGCGGSCGSCGDGEICSADGQCGLCKSDCAVGMAGDKCGMLDICGNICNCQKGLNCNEGICTAPPCSCDGKMCGDPDGCGGKCNVPCKEENPEFPLYPICCSGECRSTSELNCGACGKQCNRGEKCISDGRGNFSCQCSPTCNKVSCFNDGCGGNCGITCDANKNEYCGQDGTCIIVL